MLGDKLSPGTKPGFLKSEKMLGLQLLYKSVFLIHFYGYIKVVILTFSQTWESLAWCQAKACLQASKLILLKRIIQLKLNFYLFASINEIAYFFSGDTCCLSAVCLCCFCTLLAYLDSSFSTFKTWLGWLCTKNVNFVKL